MTKKDFDLIADILASFKAGIPKDNLRELGEYRTLCGMFAEKLFTTNPRFNRDLFLAECEVA
jgi:hypothetical protein